MKWSRYLIKLNNIAFVKEFEFEITYCILIHHKPPVIDSFHSILFYHYFKNFRYILALTSARIKCQA